jgi:hypothetical protein
MPDVESKPTKSLVDKEHDYVIAALQSWITISGAAIHSKQIEASEIIGLAVGMGRAAFKVAETGIQIPVPTQSVLNNSNGEKIILPPGKHAS